MPNCPLCAAEMRLRRSARGPFWGCSTFPRCKGTKDATQEELAKPVTQSECEALEATLKNLEAKAEYWRACFFEERNWWVRRMESVTPGLTPAQLREIKESDSVCHTCGQQRPKIGAKE